MVCVNICYFSGALKIPSHISVLHVEQEVVGDETEAVDSVLECDTERYELLQKEKELIQLMNLRYMYDIFRDENLQLFGKFQGFFLSIIHGFKKLQTVSSVRLS